MCSGCRAEQRSRPPLPQQAPLAVAVESVEEHPPLHEAHLEDRLVLRYEESLPVANDTRERCLIKIAMHGHANAPRAWDEGDMCRVVIGRAKVNAKLSMVRRELLVPALLGTYLRARSDSNSAAKSSQVR